MKTIERALENCIDSGGKVPFCAFFVISQNLRIISRYFPIQKVYFFSKYVYTYLIKRILHIKRGEQMNAAHRIRVIRLIEKIDKNPEFSNKIGIKNISEFTTEMQKKK